MSETEDVLELLRFELKFLEDGGYGRSPHTPWRASLMFEDSPTCLNFDDSSRPHPCSECALMQFVPEDRREEKVPCRHIPLTKEGKTIDYFYHDGSEPGLEAALGQWLRSEINRLERAAS